MEFSGFNNSNLTFNDSASLPRESLDHHPEGHHVSARDPKVSHHHAHDYFKTGLKAGASQLIDATEEVSESLSQHKYSQLANSSYTFYNSKENTGAVHERLGDPDFSYIEDLGGFNVDTSLSTKDNLVLHNEITGETHVAYRRIKCHRNFLRTGRSMARSLEALRTPRASRRLRSNSNKSFPNTGKIT
jgi:hypothetical protein